MKSICGQISRDGLDFRIVSKSEFSQLQWRNKSINTSNRTINVNTYYEEQRAKIDKIK